MATLAGLEYLQIQEMKRHNLATEKEQARYNREQQRLKSQELVNSLDMHSSRIASEEKRASASLDAEVSIARMKDESDRYKTDMSVVAKNPIASTIAGIALSAERVGTGNWGSTSSSTPVKSALKQNLEPLNSTASKVLTAIKLPTEPPMYTLGKLLGKATSKVARKVSSNIRDQE